MSDVMFDFDYGIDVTLQFSIANVGAGATPVDGVLASGQGGNGFVVPTGMRFTPLILDTEINDARTAGVSTIRMTINGAEQANGPEAVIDATNTTRHRDIAEPGAVFAAAGEEVSVSAQGDGSFAPTTADADVILIGKLVPA